MKYINYKDSGTFEIVEVIGAICLYSEERIDPNTLPKGMYAYETRTDSTHGYPLTLENKVVVNFSGTIITPVPLKIPENDFWDIRNDFFFTGASISPDDLPIFKFERLPTETI